MAKLEGSRTEQNLRNAFNGESTTHVRYLFFASIADIEGLSEAAIMFRSLADGEYGHATGHLRHLMEIGDPNTGEPLGTTLQNLTASAHAEEHEQKEMYPEMASIAREEGFEKIAEWFDTLSRSEHQHQKRLQEMLDQLEEDS